MWRILKEKFKEADLMDISGCIGITLVAIAAITFFIVMIVNIIKM